MNPLHLAESIQSAKNHVFWRLRSRVRFRRDGYQETGREGMEMSPLERELEARYGFNAYKLYLLTENYRKCLSTLWTLERALLPHLPQNGSGGAEILEPGCQDFSRLPALRAFFRNRGFSARITGLELDPFPLLHDFHSRWDKAKYYLSLEPTRDRYLEGDFFQWQEPAHLICCFYPFVSPHPALAWGLPATFGRPGPWLDSFARNLLPGGLLLLVHQGRWEEEDFDQARAAYPLELVGREQLDCPFAPLPYPACASVYRRRE